VSLGYRIRFLAVLLSLVLLQVSYVVLIVAVGFLMWLYLSFLIGATVTFNAITILFYIGPPAAGVIAVLFMLKPILIRPKRPPKPTRISPEEEPILFEFVEALCRVMGCPRPASISADLQVNAYASIQGWRGLILGRMNLTIGLPLATNLSLAQFTGVLAHEFGHFAQGAGLRSHYLIQTIQNWFARVVHQRDGLDEWLERMCRRRDWRIKGVAHLATLLSLA
jgi:Zn-dependent protease with chaperone function